LNVSDHPRPPSKDSCLPAPGRGCIAWFAWIIAVSGRCANPELIASVRRDRITNVFFCPRNRNRNRESQSQSQSKSPPTAAWPLSQANPALVTYPLRITRFFFSISISIAISVSIAILDFDFVTTGSRGALLPPIPAAFDSGRAALDHDHFLGANDY